MAKLETQINQIYLSPKESKKLSLILFEEKLASGQHLFLLAELRDIQKKTEINDLGKISEIIIESFKENKKLKGEALFESTLAEINHKLGEFAHKGRKSWLGKFSALIALQNENDFFLANTGLTSVWLKRKTNLNEILSPDKSEIHPLKTFLNFSSGRMIENDHLIFATSSLFNYVSVELFSRTLNSSSLLESCNKITDILRGSARPEEGFAVFMLQMNKKTAVEKLESDVAVSPSAKKKIKVVSAQPIYAPMPEDLDTEYAAEQTSSSPLKSLPSFKPSLALPQFKLSVPKLSFNFLSKIPGSKLLPNVSGPAKFFLLSFIVFAILFAMNIAAFGVRKAQSKQQQQFNDISAQMVNYMAEAENSLLYKNQSQAMKLMSDAETELHKLQQMNNQKATPFQTKFEEMNNKVNRVTVLRNLSPSSEMPYPLSFISRAGTGYLVSNENPNSLALYADNMLTNLFMLNKTDGNITGVTHVSGIGNFVATSNKIYRANQASKEFDQIVYISNADLLGLKFVDPNRVYTLNRNTNQVIRYNAGGTSLSSSTNLLKTNTDLTGARDFAIDTDVYILFSNKVAKFVNGNLSDFQLSNVYQPLQDLTRIRVGSNQIYLLEPITNRVLIYNKRGDLLNQVMFPELTELHDLYVDEGARELLLINGTKVYKITF
ncbi:MAG: hypothetical protein KW793_02720 [Candidatus Doudnabacteria bacterium]|nr:hypothetical protein [Candidatus Doudnabacteria bacterium]